MKPIHTFREGAIGISVWERSGSKGPYQEFTISRSFKTKDGQSAYSNSFREHDGPSLLNLIQRAVAHIRGQHRGQAVEASQDSQ